LRVQFHLLLQMFSLYKTFFYWFPRKLRTFVSFHYKLSMSWNEQRLDYYIWLLWCSIRVRSTYSVWDKNVCINKKKNCKQNKIYSPWNIGSNGVVVIVMNYNSSVIKT
jgi:hypothetical protein